MLEYLFGSDPVRHVPTVRVFCGPAASEFRDVLTVRSLPNFNGK